MRRGALRLLGLAALLAVVAGVGAGFLQLYLADLPEVRFLEDYRPSASTRLLDRTGKLIGELYIERRKPVPLSGVSPLLVKALVAVEDERFFDHVGVDLWAILRALWADLREQSLAQGGSTITQQLTRTLFLEPDKHFGRKVREAILAVQIENRYTKNEILELYCNQIYLGSGVYGVEAAALKYFGRPAARLNLPQAALLAGLPKAPSVYDPLRAPEKALKRRQVVLGRMLAARVITPEEYRVALEAPLGIATAPGGTTAPYLVEYLRQQLEDSYGSDVVYRQGLVVRTTADLGLQQAAERAVREGLEKLDKSRGWRKAALPKPEEVDAGLGERDLAPGKLVAMTVTEVSGPTLTLSAGEINGTVRAARDVFPYWTSFSGKLAVGQTVLAGLADDAPRISPHQFRLEQRPDLQGGLVAVDPRGGGVLAIVGGYDFARSPFNRAVQAHRQPGSAIKPFIYTAAIRQGLTPASVLKDEPVRYPDPSRPGGWWEPKNYDGDFVGQVTLVESLTQSRNVPTVRLLEHLGTGLVTRLIHDMGVSSPQEPNLSLALGTSNVTLLEITSAYGVLADGGILARPFVIQSVTDRQGRVLESHKAKLEKVIEPAEAYVAMDMMRSVVNHGTGRVARELGFPVAAKTGTTNDFQDAWFVGYSPSLATGVWVGYDDNHSMGRGATGASMAGPIWTSFMAAASPGGVEDFVIPEGVVLREIDAQTGQLAGPGCPDGRPVAFLQGTEPKHRCRHGFLRGLFSRKP